MSVKKITIVAIGVLLFLAAIACIIFKIVLKQKNPEEPIVSTTVVTNKTKYSDFDAKAVVYNNSVDFNKDYKDYTNMELSQYSDEYNAQEFNNYNYAVISTRLAGCNESVSEVKFEIDGDTLSVYYDIHRQ